MRKRRDLPLAGKVLVAQGERVLSDTIVAEAQREGELRIVRVAEALNVPPKDALKQICVAEGASVAKGETIAEMRGLWGLLRTTVDAPLSGTIEFISQATGHVGLRAPPSRLELRAYIDGVVVGIEPHRGVVIESEASFIQGIFGVGGERTGAVHVLSLAPDAPLTVGDIPVDCAGLVLVGGHSPTVEALQLAAQRGAVGCITGSIDDLTLQRYVGHEIGIALTGDERVSMTLIITEGFGRLCINERIVKLLSASHGARASINGATQVRAGALRPEIITRAAPSLNEIEEQRSHAGLSVGARVRLIRVPYFGSRGTVVDLPRELTQIETGAWARVARVRVDETLSEVAVPRANLELL